MCNRSRRGLAALAALGLLGCNVPSPMPAARTEVVEDFGAWVPDHAPRTATRTAVGLERVTTAVPWPRGIQWVDGSLVVLARGRHRRAGGIDPAIKDRCGTLMWVDPAVSEPVAAGVTASPAVRSNARVLAAPAGPPFHLYDPGAAPIDDYLMDRPYCTLIWDEASRNLFMCGYSGVDLAGGKFRKNATDSIHRYDLREGTWHSVEKHDPDVVPIDRDRYVVPNVFYPHHDATRNAPPHGLLNGPDGGCVAGDYLYCLGKDNHVIAQYALESVRASADAGPPHSRVVLGAEVRVRSPQGERAVRAYGPSAAVARDGFLYVGYRTASIVLRFPLAADGDLLQPSVGELVAMFEPWRPTTGKSANLIDMAFNRRGELFVSCARRGRVWNVGVPDPAAPFYGDDSTGRPTSAPPYLDVGELTGKESNTGNIVFDDRDRLYLCSGNYDAGPVLAGVVYRAVE